MSTGRRGVYLATFEDGTQKLSWEDPSHNFMSSPDPDPTAPAGAPQGRIHVPPPRVELPPGLAAFSAEMALEVFERFTVRQNQSQGRRRASSYSHVTATQVPPQQHLSNSSPVLPGMVPPAGLLEQRPFSGRQSPTDTGTAATAVIAGLSTSRSVTPHAATGHEQPDGTLLPDVPLASQERWGKRRKIIAACAGAALALLLVDAVAEGHGGQAGAFAGAVWSRVPGHGSSDKNSAPQTLGTVTGVHLDLPAGNCEPIASAHISGHSRLQIEYKDALGHTAWFPQIPGPDQDNLTADFNSTQTNKDGTTANRLPEIQACNLDQAMSIDGSTVNVDLKNVEYQVLFPAAPFAQIDKIKIHPDAAGATILDRQPIGPDQVKALYSVLNAPDFDQVIGQASEIAAVSGLEKCAPSLDSLAVSAIRSMAVRQNTGKTPDVHRSGATDPQKLIDGFMAESSVDKDSITPTQIYVAGQTGRFTNYTSTCNVVPYAAAKGAKS